MDTRIKIAIGLGAVLAASGIGYLIYLKTTKPSSAPSPSIPLPSGSTLPLTPVKPMSISSSKPASPSTVLKPITTPAGSSFSTTFPVNTNVTSYVNESFPLAIGMKGTSVKSMQSALNNSFGQKLTADGYYGADTFNALLSAKYATNYNSKISSGDYNNILLGIKK